MNLRQATAAIVAAGITARLNLADDPEMEDDEIVLTDHTGVSVQVAATRNGLRFCANVASGTGDEFSVVFGREQTDPVAAARDALRIHQKGLI